MAAMSRTIETGIWYPLQGTRRLERKTQTLAGFPAAAQSSGIDGSHRAFWGHMYCEFIELIPAGTIFFLKSKNR